MRPGGFRAISGALCALTVFYLHVAAPAAAVDASPVSVERLISELGADEFRTREAASRALEAMGRLARPALREALKHPDLEVRKRAESILEFPIRRAHRAPALPEPRLREIERIQREMDSPTLFFDHKITEELARAHRALIASVDRLLDEDADGMGRAEIEVRLRALEGEAFPPPPLPPGVSEEQRSRNIAALKFLLKAQAGGRLNLARAYLFDEGDRNRKLAIELLAEIVDKFPNDYMETWAFIRPSSIGESFVDVAALARAQDDPEFVKKLPEASRREALERFNSR